MKEGYVCISITNERKLHSNERYPWRVWGEEAPVESWSSAKVFETEESAKKFLKDKVKTNYGLHIVVPAIQLF